MDTPAVIVKMRTSSTPYYVCPHCNEEIHEKGLFLDKFSTWHHRACGNPIRMSSVPTKGELFHFRVRILGPKLPEFNCCHPKCEYLQGHTCNLFRTGLTKDGDHYKRDKNFISAVEGLI